MNTKEDIIKKVINSPEHYLGDAEMIDERLNKIAENYELFIEAKNILNTETNSDEYGKLVPKKTLFRYRVDERDYGLGYVIDGTKDDNKMIWLVCMFCKKDGSVYVDAIIGYESSAAGCIIPYLGQYEIIGNVIDVDKALELIRSSKSGVERDKGSCECFCVTEEMWNNLLKRVDELEKRTKNSSSNIAKLISRDLKLK